MLNVADWDVITVKSRIPIISHMVAFAKHNTIDFLVLNGDISY